MLLLVWYVAYSLRERKAKIPDLKSVFIAGPVPAVLSIVLAAFAMMIVKTNGLAALVLFILSGGMLLLARPQGQKITAFAEVPENTSPVTRLEIAGFSVLAILVLVSRFYNLGDYTTGGQGHEGIVASAYSFLKGGFYPLIGDGLNWPTLYYYQGMFFADWLGWDITAYRLPGAIWGAAGVFAFYYMARRLTSPLTAFVFSVIYSVQQMQLVMSHVAGVHVLCFIPTVVPFALILAGLKSKRWWLFLAAGFAAGYGLHAYWAGRAVPFIFMLWFAFIFVFDRKNMPSIKNQALFWLGFVIVALPVIVNAIRDPELFFGYVSGINPNRGKGLAGYLGTIINMLPTYAGMFHIRSDVYWGFKLSYEPIFDAVMQYLFPVGFFMCFFIFWRPVSSYVIAAFCAGMLAGVLGGNNLMHPTTNRVIMAYPMAALFAAFAFERMNPGGSTALRYVFAGAGIAAAAWSAWWGLDTFFVRHQQHPALIVTSNPAGFLAGKEVKANKDAAFMCTHYIMDDTPTNDIFFPKKKDMHIPYDYDGFFEVNENKDLLYLFQGSLAPVAEYLKKELFPQADLKIVPFDKLDHEFYLKNQISYQPAANWPDPFNKSVMFARLLVRKDELKKMHDLVDANTGARLSVLSADFGEKNAGKKITASGALLFGSSQFGLNEVAANSYNARFEMGWNGWTLEVDGKKRQWGRGFSLSRGTHFITISGTAPASAKGALPLSVFADGQNQKRDGTFISSEEIVSAGKLIAIRKPIGMTYSYSFPPDTWGVNPSVVRQQAFNIKYMGAVAMPCTFAMRADAYLTVPVSAEYVISGSLFTGAAIYIDGEKVFDNLQNNGVPVIAKKVKLDKNRRYKLRADFQVTCVETRQRVYALYYQTEKDKDPVLMPPDWVSPY
jgi:hypothetical protein